MKRILTIGGVLTGLLGGLMGSGCTSAKSEKFVSKTDTVNVIYRDQNGLQGARGTYTTHEGYKIDTVSKKVIDGIDTAWSLSLPNLKDTLKVNGKPVYDSVSHTYRFNTYWYKLTDQENKTVKIQIIKI